MNSENNNELNRNGQSEANASEVAGYEDFPEGFDEMSDDDLMADLEALANELQDFPSDDSSYDSYEEYDEEAYYADEYFADDNLNNNFAVEDEWVFSAEESSQEKPLTYMVSPYEDNSEEVPEDEEIIPEETADEDNSEEVPEDEEIIPEETADEDNSEEVQEDEEIIPEETADEDYSEEVQEDEKIIPEETADEDNYEEVPEDEEIIPEETAEEEYSEDEAPSLDSIDELVDEIQEQLSEETIEDNTKLQSDELIQLADVLSDAQTAPTSDAFESVASESTPVPEENADGSQFQDQSAGDTGHVTSSELDNLATVMHMQNDEANSFLGGVNDSEDKESSAAPIMSVVESESLAEIMSAENDEANSIADFVDDDDEDIKLFVKNSDSSQDATAAQPVDKAPDEELLDKTIVNIPVTELLTEELTEELTEDDIGQTSVFEPVRPEPSYGEAVGRNTSYYYDEEKPSNGGKKKKRGFFRGVTLIAGLLIAVVFISWLLSLVAFSVMGADDTVSAEEYNYSTTSTIIKPFNDDDPEPVVVPEFTAEKLTIGDTGEMVDAVQRTLASLGYLAQDKVSGTYDSATQKAVTKFQQANFLEATGEVDSLTYEQLLLQPGRQIFHLPRKRQPLPRRRQRILLHPIRRPLQACLQRKRQNRLQPHLLNRKRRTVPLQNRKQQRIPSLPSLQQRLRLRRKTVQLKALRALLLPKARMYLLDDRYIK